MEGWIKHKQSEDNMTRTMFHFCLLNALGFNSFADALDTWTKVSATPYGSLSQMAYGNGMFAANSVSPYAG